MPDLDTRRRHPRTLLALILVTTVVVATATWQAIARNTLADVTVTPGSMQCDGKDVPAVVVPDASDDEPPVATFRPDMTPASDCSITVVVANGGSRPVHLSSLTFDAMMPGESGRFLLETPRELGGEEPREVDGAGDAIFDTDETIEPDSWIEKSFEIRYRVDGPTCPGVNMGHSDFPKATLSSWGVSRSVVGSIHLVHTAVETEANRGNCG